MGLASISNMLRLVAAVLLLSVCCPECHGFSSLKAGRAMLGKAEWQFDPKSDKSSISCVHGHYPPPFCTTTNVALNHKTRVFTVYSKDADMTFANEYLFRMAAESRENFPKCDQTVDEAYLFTYFFYHGQSNYFHLHKDTLFPIFTLLDAKRKSKDAEERDRPVVMMPVVEKRRMAEIDWESGAFSKQYLSQYFNLVLKALAGPHALLPLDIDLVAKRPNGFTCFRKAYFGAPGIGGMDKSPQFMKSFVAFMMKRLRVQRGKPGKPLLGLIKRAGRRKVFNEEELVSAVRNTLDVDAEMVEFSGMTLHQQVAAVQKYTVLIGMNGAGFMNAIYLPVGSVAVQLAPFNATMLNVKEFGEIVAARGPYLFWRNEHAELSRQMPGDTYNSQAGTFVKVEEFVELARKALALGINKGLWRDPASAKTEL